MLDGAGGLDGVGEMGAEESDCGCDLGGPAKAEEVMENHRGGGKRRYLRWWRGFEGGVQGLESRICV